MSIPLDRYYHYIENLCGDDTIIYHWYPHGSKKLENLKMIKEHADEERYKLNLSLSVICHDQEPLSLANYTPADISKLHSAVFSTNQFGSYQFYRDVIKDISPIRNSTINPLTVYDKLLLCHSEKNSTELTKFEDQGFIGVYVWFHGIISRDWFRHAEHDPALKQDTTYKYDFLIYNRAWTGTREYRLKFCELILESQLVDRCKTSFAPSDNGVHYTQYKCQNTDFALTNYNLEDFYVKNETTSCFSADYDSLDYNECGLEVVLETLFDDNRNHLTEKALRPIACNKPFILASTPFSLEYLRNYGFKTFHGLIDETYDTIIDPVQRLNAIVNELKRISCLSATNKQDLWKQLNAIAAYNQKLFFSKQWHEMVLDEFKTNLNHGLELAKQHRTAKYLRKIYKQLEINQIPFQSESRKILDQWLLDNGLYY